MEPSMHHLWALAMVAELVFDCLANDYHVVCSM